MPSTVSIIGLGLVGRLLARTLLRTGFDVRGWNRSSFGRKTLQIQGARMIEQTYVPGWKASA